MIESQQSNPKKELSAADKFLSPGSDHCYQCTRDFDNRGAGIVSVMDCENLNQGFEFCVIFPQTGLIITRLFGPQPIADALEVTKEEAVQMLVDRINRESLIPQLVELIQIYAVDFKRQRTETTDGDEDATCVSPCENQASVHEIYTISCYQHENIENVLKRLKKRPFS